MEVTWKKALIEVSSLTEKLKEKESTYQTLQDEYQALHTVADASEAKLESLKKENDQLVSLEEEAGNGSGEMKWVVIFQPYQSEW